ncbi:MAG: 30S ribosomal protein S12 methylthiotransferase RimO [Lachnospiraceae bacterium]|nr:30S ribosomal protein S12 methylthiotransferase RimO [Lachnospiraceae bacterium]
MKLLFVSLGCDKNLVDSEKMLGILAERGYSFTDDEEEAEAAVVNTCCFIGDAKEESIGELLRLGELRKSGQLKALVAAGCLAQRYREELLREIPEVDAVLGTMATCEIAQALEDVITRGKVHEMHLAPLDAAPCQSPKRSLTTGGHYAYLKIAEGCDRCCTYCIIPKVRGPYRSIPMESLLEEARMLAGRGVRELILVAQETTLYGRDLYGKKSLHLLLERLCEIPELSWIRILYAYPEEIDDELIDCMARHKDRIVPYLDLPIQSGSDGILKRMGRRTDRAGIESLIGRLRERIPEICLRTTLISGFPGETQEDFEETYRFVNEMEFDRLGVFAYSAEEDTPAALFPDQIPEEVKEFRRDELMALQQEICLEKNQSLIGTLLPVMVEGYLPEDGVYVGRTYRDAPGVDGLIFFEAGRELLTGEILSVRVTGAQEYDLEGIYE